MPTPKSIKRKERYHSEPEFRERIKANQRRYAAKAGLRETEAVRARWQEWAEKNPDKREQSNKASRERHKATINAKTVLSRKAGVPVAALPADLIEAKALEMEITRWVDGRKPPKFERKRAYMAKRRQDTEFRKKHQEYCRDYYQRNREALCAAARKRRALKKFNNGVNQ